jgi:hypothetical protein
MARPKPPSALAERVHRLIDGDTALSLDGRGRRRAALAFLALPMFAAFAPAVSPLEADAGAGAAPAQHAPAIIEWPAEPHPLAAALVTLQDDIDALAAELESFRAETAGAAEPALSQRLARLEARLGRIRAIEAALSRKLQVEDRRSP